MSEPPATPKAGVVILAAGEGRRLPSVSPKQFLELAGRPLFAYSLELFDALPYVTEIVLVIPRGGLPGEHRDQVIGLDHRLTETTGGERRQDSAAAGLGMLHEPCDVALVHDAARPFAAPKAIGRLVVAADRTGGGLLAVPASDTVKLAGSERYVAETLDRERVWLAQTPQAIRADLVDQVIEELRRPDLNVTDEAAVLERLGVPVALVEGDRRNFKITTPGDLAHAEAILAQEKT